MSAIAASKAASLRVDGSRKPLTLRTYCLAAAWISPVVAGSALLRRVRMLLHMAKRLAGASTRLDFRARTCPADL